MQATGSRRRICFLFILRIDVKIKTGYVSSNTFSLFVILLRCKETNGQKKARMNRALNVLG